MPFVLNRDSSILPFPKTLAGNKRGKGCTFSSSRKKKVRKKYKNKFEKHEEYSNVRSNFSLTPALVTILESLGYKVKKRQSS